MKLLGRSVPVSLSCSKSSRKTHTLFNVDFQTPVSSTSPRPSNMYPVCKWSFPQGLRERRGGEVRAVLAQALKNIPLAAPC